MITVHWWELNKLVSWSHYLIKLKFIHETNKWKWIKKTTCNCVKVEMIIHATYGEHGNIMVTCFPIYGSLLLVCTLISSNLASHYSWLTLWPPWNVAFFVLICPPFAPLFIVLSLLSCSLSPLLQLSLLLFWSHLSPLVSPLALPLLLQFYCCSEDRCALLSTWTPSSRCCLWPL